MASESRFPMRRLGDLAVFVNGDRGKNYPKESDFVPNGVPFISATDIALGRLDVRTGKTISRSAYDRLGNGKIKEGDLLYCLRGSVGKSAIVTGQVEGAIASSLVIVRGNEVADTRYIRYVLSSEFGQSIAKGLNNGSVQPNISVRDLKEAKVPAPSLNVQNALVDFLGSLDSRIDLIQEANTTLEAIAQAVFKAWFVDFDPVRAKAQGLTHVGMDADTAAQFPDGFEESELGSIPKGWHVAPFADEVNVMGGGTPKTSVDDYWNGDIPWFSVVDAPKDGQVFTLGTEKAITQAGLDNCSAKLLPEFTTIISARGTVGKIAMTARSMTINQSCYGLLPLVEGGEFFVYFATKSVVESLRRIVHGAVFDTITRDSLRQVHICAAPAAVVAVFGGVVRPIFERIRSNGLHAKHLGDLRDTLLPRLISGKLRLSEAEAIIEDAVA